MRAYCVRLHYRAAGRVPHLMSSTRCAGKQLGCPVIADVRACREEERGHARMKAESLAMDVRKVPIQVPHGTHLEVGVRAPRVCARRPV